MPDEPTPDAAPQDHPVQEEPPSTKEHAIRALLQALDPHPNDAKLSYANVLARLQTVMLREMQAQAALEPTSPAMPGMPPAPVPPTEESPDVPATLPEQEE